MLTCAFMVLGVVLGDGAWPPPEIRGAWQVTQSSVDGSQLPMVESTYVVFVEQHMVHTAGGVDEFDGETPFFMLRRIKAWSEKNNKFFALVTYGGNRGKLSVQPVEGGRSIQINLEVQGGNESKVDIRFIAKRVEESLVRREWSSIYSAIDHKLTSAGDSALRDWLALAKTPVKKTR